jgi:hypothetical protein
MDTWTVGILGIQGAEKRSGLDFVRIPMAMTSISWELFAVAIYLPVQTNG